MPKRNVVQVDGQKYIALPYTGFARLGLPTDPPVPNVAVPLYDSVEDSLTEPLSQARDYEEDLKAQGVAGVAALIRGIAKPHSGNCSPQAKQLTFEDKLGFPFVFFRGERREEFGILPTSYRQLVNTKPQSINRLMRRQARIERRLACKIRVADLIGRRTWLTPIQARAAARHYGAASTLLDFSFDPRVAAAFAHPTFRTKEREDFAAGKGPVGIIYGLSYRLLQQCFPMQGWAPAGPETGAISFYFVGTTIEVPYLAFDERRAEIRPNLCRIAFPSYFANTKVSLHTAGVSSVKRIKAQQGLFIELTGQTSGGWADSLRLWYFLDFLCDKWCFVRRDAQYEDRPAICAQSLFPKDALPLRMAVWPRR